MAKIMIVTLPDVNQTVAFAWNDVATETIACYLMDVSHVDMRAIPSNPPEQYRVSLDARVTSNLVSALRELIVRMAG